MRTTIALLLCAGGAAAWGDSKLRLDVLGIVSLPSGERMDGAVVGGLSSIAYDPGSDRFWALSDFEGPGMARLFEIDLPYDGAGVGEPKPVAFRPLLLPDGSRMPGIDAEGLALLPGADVFFVSTEGRMGGDREYGIPPWVGRFDAATARLDRLLPVPEVFLPRDAEGRQVYPGAPAQATGVRYNFGFEALGATPSGAALYVANEAALLQDDPRPPFDSQWNQANGSAVRITRFDDPLGDSPAAAAQRVYVADAGSLFFVVRRFNTVSSLLPVDDSGRILVLERGLIANSLDTGSYRIRIYEVDFNEAGATDVSEHPSLIDSEWKALSKRRVWEASSGMDNIEGMTWGRPVDGFRTLVLISDDNFFRRSSRQETQFVVLRTNISAGSESRVAALLKGVPKLPPALGAYLDKPEGGERRGDE
ncbi:MAG: esterase-like activity of phytase family protein [Opitutales bacterium]|nr:esterase-like activity of phytase family protein [Opitutales bacterium]